MSISDTIPTDASTLREMDKSWLCGHAVRLEQASMAREFNALVAQNETLWFFKAAALAACIGVAASLRLEAPLAATLSVGASTFGLSTIGYLKILRLAHDGARNIVDETAQEWIDATRELGRDPLEVSKHIFLLLDGCNIIQGDHQTTQFRIIERAFAKLTDSPPAKKTAIGKLCLSFAVKTSRSMAFGKAAKAKLAEQEPPLGFGLAMAQKALPEAVAAMESTLIGQSIAASPPPPAKKSPRL